MGNDKQIIDIIGAKSSKSGIVTGPEEITIEADGMWFLNINPKAKRNTAANLRTKLKNKNTFQIFARHGTKTRTNGGLNGHLILKKRGDTKSVVLHQQVSEDIANQLRLTMGDSERQTRHLRGYEDRPRLGGAMGVRKR